MSRSTSVPSTLNPANAVPLLVHTRAYTSPSRTVVPSAYRSGPFVENPMIPAFSETAAAAEPPSRAAHTSARSTVFILFLLLFILSSLSLP